MKKCSTITEISLEDFLKLNLVGYEHRKHYYKTKQEKVGDGYCYLPEQEIDYKDTGEWVKDSQGNPHWVQFDGIISKLVWDKVNLNDIVRENIEFSNEEGFKNRCICVAIHTEPSEEEIEEITKKFNYVKSYREGSNNLTKYTREEAYEQLLFEYSYLDKWLTRSGNQTYLLRCDVQHLYSEKRKFVTHDDYFEVPKSETKAVYLIRY